QMTCGPLLRGCDPPWVVGYVLELRNGEAKCLGHSAYKKGRGCSRLEFSQQVLPDALHGLWRVDAVALLDCLAVVAPSHRAAEGARAKLLRTRLFQQQCSHRGGLHIWPHSHDAVIYEKNC